MTHFKSQNNQLLNISEDFQMTLLKCARYKTTKMKSSHQHNSQTPHCHAFFVISIRA